MTSPSRGAKRPSPLSIRLNDAEFLALRGMAGNMPLSTFVKRKLFDKKGGAKPIDKTQIAYALALLGSSQLAPNIVFLAEAARCGSVFENESSVQALDRACEDIHTIRSILLESLGKRSHYARALS